MISRTSGVKLKSVSEIGKARDHRRLVVEDEEGNAQNILWWNGAGEELPEEGSRFDVAYSIRASTYRGEHQVTVQFKEFRVVEEKAVEVHRPKLEINDWRLEIGRFESLPAGTLVWAEGVDKAKGNSRFDLNRRKSLRSILLPHRPPIYARHWKS